jgi:hypothetical protein
MAYCLLLLYWMKSHLRRQAASNVTQTGDIRMSIKAITSRLLICWFGMVGIANALPISNSDLWHDANIDLAGSSPDLNSGNGSSIHGFFDGAQVPIYGREDGNSIFRGGASGQTIYWTTASEVTVRSINFVTYHDFDGFNITSRGIQSFSLSFWADGDSSWHEFFDWTYTNPNNDLHYGGGPSFQFDPDNHDLNRSFMELTANLDSAITAQTFRADFVQYGGAGSRIVELDAYSAFQSIPLPASFLLFVPGLIGVVCFRKYQAK